jgi:hypothetical protein
VTVEPFFKDAPNSRATKPYSIAFFPVRPLVPFGTPQAHTKTKITLSLAAERWSHFVQAVYPIPQVDILFSWTDRDIPYIPYLYPKVASCLEAGELLQFAGGYDRVALILPEKSLNIPFLDEIYGLTEPRISDVVLGRTGCQFILAHEMGHTYGLSHDYNGSIFVR